MNLHDINDQLINGEIDALDAYIKIKQISDTANNLMKSIKKEAVDEADKYDGKTFQAFGCQIEKRSGGGVWDYKHLPDWNDAKEKVKAIEEVHKTAYKLTGKEELVNPETGEIVQPAIFKPNSETIAIKPL